MVRALATTVQRATPPLLPQRDHHAQAIATYNAVVGTITTTTDTPAIRIWTNATNATGTTNGLIIANNTFTATTGNTGLIVNTDAYPYWVTIPEGTTITANNWYGTPAMVVCTALNLAEITPLEAEVLNEYPALVQQIDDALKGGSAITSEWLAYIADEELLTMPDRELFPLALATARKVEAGLNLFESKTHDTLRTKIQEFLHHPANPWVVSGGSYAFKQRAFDWSGLEIEDEREIGEDCIRAMLNRHYFPIALRWRRDVQILRRAKAWARTPEGNVWVQADDAKRRQAALRAELEAEQLMGRYEVRHQAMQAATRVLESKYERLRLKKKRETEGLVKASIKKATKLFDRMDQTSKLRLFVANQEVVIDSEASKTKIVVRSTGGPGWLFDRTQKGRSHTPYELMVLTKDDVFLMKLCVYFKDTPVLDQLLAISVLVDAGDEERLLTRGNWFGHHGSWTPEKTDYIANAYPELVKRCPEHYPQAKPRVGQVNTTNQIIPADGTMHTGVIYTNYQNESQVRWDPFEGRVRQWIKTWMETTMSAPRELTLH